MNGDGRHLIASNYNIKQTRFLLIFFYWEKSVIGIQVRYTIFAILFLINSTFLLSQDKLWYFGDGFGLDFRQSDSPVLLTDGSSSRFIESGSTLTDASDNLLAYTDGINVWGKNHSLIRNGSDLLGISTPTQGALFVPRDSTHDNYFLFTVNPGSIRPSSLSYSELIFHDSSPLGEIVMETKNSRLLKDVTEKMIAVGDDLSTIWLIVHKADSDEFYSYPIIKGEIRSPVISNVGSVHTREHIQGQMKINKSKTKLALTAGIGIIELFDFDIVTGNLSNVISLNSMKILDKDAFNYGIEFSESGDLLYVTESQVLFDSIYISQFDLSNVSENAINQSKITFTAFERRGQLAGITCALQRGPDDKIYVGRDEYSYISYIKYPNLRGDDATFIDDGIYLGPGRGFEGSGFHNEVPDFPINNDITTAIIDTCYNPSVELLLCENEDILLSVPQGASDMLWSDGAVDFDNLIDEVGNYSVTYVIDNCLFIDSFEISSLRIPSISLALPFSECADSNIFVVGEFQQYDSIVWSTGQVGDALSVYESGEYTAVAYSGDCNVSRTVSVDLKEPVDFSIVRSQTSCDADSVTLSVDMNATQYLWNNASSASEITVKRGAQYWVEIEIDGCMHRDSIMIESESKFSLGKDVSTCDQESVILSPLDLNADLYNWSTGETSSSIEVSSSGSYWLEAQLGECLLRDTIQVSFDFANALDLGDMILTCHTDPITLMSNIEGELYSWSTGEDTPIIEVTATGSYTLEVESTEECIYRDTIDIVFDELSVDLGADQEICIGDSTILSAPSPETLSSILWSDGSVDPDLIVRSADSYWLAIERGMCFASDTIMISYGVCDMIPDSMMIDTMMIDTMTGSPGFFVPDELCQVYVPNAISADATRPLNRVFQIFSDCALSSINIKIYDRWGNLHYQISDTVISDDDILIQPGVYVAKVEYRFEDGDEVEQVLQSVTVL